MVLTIGSGGNRTVTTTSSTHTSSSSSRKIVGGNISSTRFYTTSAVASSPFYSTTTRYVGSPPLGSYVTRPQYVTHGYVTQQPSMLMPSMVPTMTVPSLTTSLTPSLAATPPLMVGSATTIMPNPTMGVAPTTAQMGVAPQMGLATKTETEQSSKHTLSSASSITINGMLCEGHIVIEDDHITHGLNIFIGSAPFTMNPDDFEITPEHCVVTRDPNVKFHVGAIEEPSTIDDLREASGVEGDLHLGIPGQNSCKLTLDSGKLMLTPDEHS